MPNVTEAAVVGIVPPEAKAAVGTAVNSPLSTIVVPVIVPPALVVPTMYASRGLKPVSSTVVLPIADTLTGTPPLLNIRAGAVAVPHAAPPAAIVAAAIVCNTIGVREAPEPPPPAAVSVSAVRVASGAPLSVQTAPVITPLLVSVKVTVPGVIEPTAGSNGLGTIKPVMVAC